MLSCKRFIPGFQTVWFRAGIPNHIPLPIEAGDKHWTIVVVATWLIGSDQWRFAPFWSHVAQAFAEASLAELARTTKELQGIFTVVRSNTGLHRPIVIVAER
jgi:hypothetical protein